MDFDDFELDLPPEYCHYQDNGCEFANSCLDCPFPDCLYAEPGGRQRWLKTLRDEAVLRLFTDQGKKVKDLALMFGVSRRTIQRILKQDKGISTLGSRFQRGLMDKNSIVSQLNRQDIDRMRAYRERLDFYHGWQWQGRERRGEKRLTFNYARVFIDKVASYLMSGVNIAVDAMEDSAEAAEKAR